MDRGFKAMMRLVALLLVPLLATGAAAQSQTPTEVVKAFYDHPGLELDPAARDRFADPARKILDENDVIRKTEAEGCIDPGMAFDNAEVDRAEITRTLKFAEQVKDSQAKVITGFTVGGEAHRMEWKLVKIGDAWKISDLLSVTGEWALSQFGCQ